MCTQSAFIFTLQLIWSGAAPVLLLSFSDSERSDCERSDSTSFHSELFHHHPSTFVQSIAFTLESVSYFCFPLSFSPVSLSVSIARSDIKVAIIIITGRKWLVEERVCNSCRAISPASAFQWGQSCPKPATKHLLIID